MARWRSGPPARREGSARRRPSGRWSARQNLKGPAVRPGPVVHPAQEAAASVTDRPAVLEAGAGGDQTVPPMATRASAGGWHARRRAALRVAQFGSFVVILGIPDGILGVLWPSMRHGLHRPLADLGALIAAGTALYFVGGLLGDRVRRALGSRQTILWSIVVGLVSILGWAGAPGWWVLLASLAVLGLVKGILDAVLNAEVALEGGVRQLGLLHASWAIGGTLGPVIVAALVVGGQWRVAVGVVAAAAAALVPFAALGAAPTRATACTAPTAPAAPPGSPAGAMAEPAGRPPLREAAPGRLGGTAAPHGRPAWAGIAATMLAFALYVAAEAGPVSWGATYLQSDRHFSTAGAAVAMASFWAALTIGRLALAVPHPWHPARVLEVSTWCFVAGTALFWLLPGRLAVIGLPVAGLGSATIFPLYMALTPERLGEDATGRAVGYAIAGSAVGGPAAVAGFGLLAAHLGTGVLGPCLLGAAVLMYLAHRLLAVVVRPGCAAERWPGTRP